jgi:GNAT superfamily N-acetyltransferase
MTDAPRIEVLSRGALTPARYDAILALCTRAYEEPFAEYLAPFGDATHVLATVDGELVSHAMWVPRTLTHRGTPLRCAYVEAVATEPTRQRRGHATRVLRALADAITDFELGALSPSDAAFYARLGWEPWRGPLAVATGDVASGDAVTPTPDEEVMILRLPRTPALDLDGPLVAPWRPGEVW